MQCAVRHFPAVTWDLGSLAVSRVLPNLVVGALADEFHAESPKPALQLAIGHLSSLFLPF